MYCSFLSYYYEHIAPWYSSLRVPYSFRKEERDGKFITFQTASLKKVRGWRSCSKITWAYCGLNQFFLQFTFDCRQLITNKMRSLEAVFCAPFNTGIRCNINLWQDKLKPVLHNPGCIKFFIDVAVPSLRSSASVRAKSASSCKSQPVRRTGIPLPLAQSAGRGKTSASLKHRSLWSPQSAVPQTHYHICNATFSSSLPAKRPATAIGRGPYANIQAKVNSIPHDVRKLKRDRSPTNTSLLDPKKVINKENKIQTAHLNTPREETKVAANGDEISERMVKF